jgi:indolepyruvate ferredoxin oxidoreductase, beta subunit
LNQMKRDIILAGVGGQGILSIAAAIGTAALNAGLHLKQSEVHGMSQRGGDVHSNLRISDKPILSDLIAFGTANMIISLEPMESLRYLPWLSKDGWLITNTVPYINIPNYPDLDKVHAEVAAVGHHVLLDADQMAKDLGAIRSANMVILGAATPYLGIEYGQIQDAIRLLFKSKGSDIVELNIKALEAGRTFAIAQG